MSWYGIFSGARQHKRIRRFIFVIAKIVRIAKVIACTLIQLINVCRGHERRGIIQIRAHRPWRSFLTKRGLMNQVVLVLFRRPASDTIDPLYPWIAGIVEWRFWKRIPGCKLLLLLIRRNNSARVACCGDTLIFSRKQERLVVRFYAINGKNGRLWMCKILLIFKLNSWLVIWDVISVVDAVVVLVFIWLKRVELLIYFLSTLILLAAWAWRGVFAEFIASWYAVGGLLAVFEAFAFVVELELIDFIFFIVFIFVPAMNFTF